LGNASTGLGESATTVTAARFADAMDGYVFGPALWVTHDGARSWQQVNPGGPVVGLATAGGRADAAVKLADGVKVLATPVTREAFSAVTPGVANPAGIPTETDPDLVVLHPPAGFASLGASGQYPNGQALIYAENASGRWAQFPDPCYQQRNRDLGFASFTAPDAINLFSLCTGHGAAGSTKKEVVLTHDGRSSAVGTPPDGGDGGQIAAASTSTLVVASRSGASWLYRSTNGGRTWSTAVMFADGGAGLSELGFTTATQGVVIHGRPTAAGDTGSVPTPDQLLMTRDAGATWQPVSF
jgi:hypothetical protein